MTARVINIPLQIPSQNETEKGRTWRARAATTARRRAQWKMACLCEMRREVIPFATRQRRVHIVAYRHRRCDDIANLIGGAKACVDGLVDAGLLVDDRDSKAKITYEQRVRSEHPSRKACTVITVEDLT